MQTNHVGPVRFFDTSFRIGRQTRANGSEFEMSTHMAPASRAELEYRGNPICSGLHGTAVQFRKV